MNQFTTPVAPKVQIDPKLASNSTGADAYARCLMEEAEKNRQAVDWSEYDRLQQTCLDVDLAQSETTDWRG